MNGAKDGTDTIVPQAGSILQWMRINVAVLMFVTTAITAVGSALIAGVLRVDEVAHDLADVNNQLAQQRQASDRFHLDMVDVDKRLNAASVGISDGQHICENRDAVLEQRIAVLEAQVKFLADRIPPPSVGRK